MSNAEEEIELFQDNLRVIRRTVEWTEEELGKKIGVTKQTICNLERKRTKLSKTQYIAIRAVLDYEAATNPQKRGIIWHIELHLQFNLTSNSISRRKSRPPIETFTINTAPWMRMIMDDYDDEYISDKE